MNGEDVNDGYFKIRILRLNVIQALLGREDAEEFNVFLWEIRLNVKRGYQYRQYQLTRDAPLNDHGESGTSSSTCSDQRIQEEDHIYWWGRRKFGEVWVEGCDK
jgi:hypothetical protein